MDREQQSTKHPVVFTYRSDRIKSNGEPMLCYKYQGQPQQGQSPKGEVRVTATLQTKGVLVMDFNSLIDSRVLNAKDQAKLIERVSEFALRCSSKTEECVKLTVLRLDMRAFNVNVLGSTTADNRIEEYTKHTKVFTNLIGSDLFTNLYNQQTRSPVVIMPLYPDDEYENDIMSINENSDVSFLPNIRGKDILIKRSGQLDAQSTTLTNEDINYMIDDLGQSADITRYYMLPIQLDFSVKHYHDYGLLKNLNRWFWMIQWMYLFLFEWGRSVLVTVYIGGYKGKVWSHQAFTIIASRMVDYKIRRSSYAWYNAQWYFNVLPHGSNYLSKRGNLSNVKGFVYLMPTNFFTYFTYIPVFFVFYFMATSKLFGNLGYIMDGWFQGSIQDFIPTGLPAFTILNVNYLKYALYLLTNVTNTVIIFILQTIIGLKYFILYATDAPTTTTSPRKYTKTLVMIYFLLFPILSCTTIPCILLIKIFQFVSYLYGTTMLRFNKTN